MKKEFDLKIEGGTLESIKIDSSSSLIVATYKRDVAEFKAGDILIDAYDDYKPLRYISIFKEKLKNRDGGFSASTVFDIHTGKFRHTSEDWDEIKNNRLATDEEKQLLFDALKKEGLRWNAEKLEIEKIAPKFPTKLEEIDRPWYIAGHGHIANVEDRCAQTPNHFTSKEKAKEALEFIKLLAFRDAIWAIEGEPESTDIDISINFKTNEGAEHFEKIRREIVAGNL